MRIFASGRGAFVLPTPKRLETISYIYDIGGSLPETRVVLFRTDRGDVPVLETIDRLLKRGDLRLAAKFRVKIERLAAMGFELRRPDADYLDDGIYELRIIHRRVHYRVLYFYSDDTAVLSHVVRKEGRVSPTEIERAARNRRLYELSPREHTHAL
jgi:phage-related protein